MDEHIPAFTPAQASKLSGVPRRTMLYWQQIGVFTPTWVDDTRWLKYKYLYSFRDLVTLRTLRILREAGVSSEDLRRTAEHIKLHAADPWSAIRFQLSGSQIHFEAPEEGFLLHGPRVVQIAAPFNMEAVVQELREQVREATTRKAQQIGQIDCHRKVPTVAGTRIPTRAIWHYAEDGYSVNAIQRQYPTLHAEDITAAVEFEHTRRQKHSA